MEVQKVSAEVQECLVLEIGLKSEGSAIRPNQTKVTNNFEIGMREGGHRLAAHN